MLRDEMGGVRGEWTEILTRLWFVNMSEGDNLKDVSAEGS